MTTTPNQEPLLPENIKLLGCPFCGSKATKRTEFNERQQKDIFYVQCERCSARSLGCFQRFQSFEQWNTRTAQPAPSNEQCDISSYSSRRCELGTQGCDVPHSAPPTPAKMRTWQDLDKLAEEIDRFYYKTRWMKPSNCIAAIKLIIIKHLNSIRNEIMRTSKDWTEEYFGGTAEQIGVPFTVHEEHVKSIQQDAINSVRPEVDVDGIATDTSKHLFGDCSCEGCLMMKKDQADKIKQILLKHLNPTKK